MSHLLFTRLLLTGALLVVAGGAQAADEVELFPLQQAIDAATAAGKLDGSVSFYLNDTGPKGRVLSTGVVTNKKSNAVGKSNQTACIWTAQSALISLQQAAKNAGANAVTNITSYFRTKTYRDDINFECYIGTIMSGVALRGDLVQVNR